MAKHKSFTQSRRQRNRKPVVFSFDWETEDVEGNVAEKTYKFQVKASFALMESIQEIEQEVAEKTQGDPELKNPETRMWAFKKAGEILEVMVGEDMWKELKYELEAEDAMELLQWIGDGLAEDREQNAAIEADSDEEKPSEEQEVGPEDAPTGEEGKQSEGLTSPRTTS